MMSGGITPAPPTCLRAYFNTAAFVPLSDVPRGIYGDARRGLIYGPGDVTTDSRGPALSQYRRRLRLQLRAEMFNLFNQANFGNPNTTLSSGASFGRITGAGAGPCDSAGREAGLVTARSHHFRHVHDGGQDAHAFTTSDTRSCRPRPCCSWRLAPSVAFAQQPAETAIPDKVRLFIPYKDYSQEDNKRILEMYKWLRVADVSDGMDVVGLQDVGIVDPEIHALWKDTEKFTHRTVGIAVTARYVPTNRREPKMEQKIISQWYSTITSEAFMKVLSPGSMLVIDAMEDGESRSIGSSNILSWKKLGMVGLVTSGGLADTDEIIYHKVPTWFRRLARGIRPGRNELESVNRPVTVGGVLVRPGDVVVADGDGVVVVPRERAEEVAKAALPFLDNVTRERYIKETGNNPWAKKPGGQD